MRSGPLRFVVLALSIAAVATGQEAPKIGATFSFVLGVDTYFDFGPPFHYYEIFVVVPTKNGITVEKFTLTPPAHRCYAPEKTEYVQRSATLSVKELLAGEDPCKIREKDLKTERKRKKHELNFSGANVALQISCGGAKRTIKTSVLERDWFLAHPGTPKNTNWTIELLGKLRGLTGPGVMEKPAIPMTETGPVEPLSADPVSLEDLKSGKYDSLFPGAEEKASEIYLASLAPPPQPTVTLLNSTPVQPLHFILPTYPRLAWMVSYEGEAWAVAQIDPQGNVVAVLVAGGSELFASAVRDAMKDWKFPAAPPSSEIEEHIIKGRPFGVRFECVAQTSPERSTLL